MAENGWNNQRRGGGGSGSGSFFGLPKLFTSFAVPKAILENEAVISPKSILDGKPFSTLRNSFWSDPNSNSPRTPDSKRGVAALGSCSTVGLGIANVLQDEEPVDASVKQEPRPALFGSKLKIQISPLTNNSSETPSPGSPSDFGIKTDNSNTHGYNPTISSPVPNTAIPGVRPSTDPCPPGRWNCRRTTPASSPMGRTRRPPTYTVTASWRAAVIALQSSPPPPLQKPEFSRTTAIRSRISLASVMAATRASRRMTSTCTGGRKHSAVGSAGYRRSSWKRDWRNLNHEFFSLSYPSTEFSAIFSSLLILVVFFSFSFWS